MLQKLLLIAWTASVAFTLSVALPAQDQAPAETTSAAPTVNLERIEGVQKALATSTDLPEDVRTVIASFIQQATTDLTAAEAAEAQAAGFEKRAGETETDRVRLEKEVAQPAEAVTVKPGRSIAELESERVEVQARLAQLESELKQPGVDLSARTASRKAARDALADLPAKLSELQQQLAAAPPEGESPLVTQSRTLSLEVQQRLLQARINAAQKELALYDAADAVNLPTMRREVKTRELNTKQKRLEALTSEINLQRQREAERRAREAEIEKMNADPVLRVELDENQKIARTEQDVRVLNEDANVLLREVAARYEQIHSDAKDARELDDDVGLENRGLWLRKERDSLDDLPALYERIQEQTDRSTDALFAFYEWEDQLDDLASLEEKADELTSRADATSEVDPEEFREKAVQVLRSRAVNLQKLVDEYSDYTITLDALSGEYQKLSTEADDYANFLDERILWVRSHLPISMATVREESATLSHALSPFTWATALKAIGWDIADHLLMYGSVALLVIFLLMGRGRYSRQLREVAERASGRVNVSMAPTIHCMILTIWLAIVWPGLILFFAWRLRESTISSPELQVAALNLARLASVFFLLEFVRQSVRPYGLAEAHFNWNTKTLRRTRRLLWTLILFGLPIAAIVASLHQQEYGSRRDDIERLMFVASMFVLVGFAHGLLHPKRGVLCQTKSLHDGGWFDRLDYLWYFIAIGAPLGLAALAFLGYYDTAVRLAIKVQRTAWLVVAAIYLLAFASRWLMLRHRRLRIEKARERLAAAQEASKVSSESGAPIPEIESSGVDLEESSEQSQKLLRIMVIVACLSGVWLVWVDVLPAIRFLDRWPIWETTVQTFETVTNETTGVSEQRPKVEVRAVTVASLMQVLIIVLLTFTAAKNLPGLLEMSVLARLPIDRSTAYAITSLTRYGVVLIGLILASKALGISWANVQWLAAALTFGLGFGLQEIFANFVSGLIILFEQPVRVGDVVTVEGVSGVVNRIRIRATTIVDWDRKEYIVPNREFITGRLLNWTLSDKMNRLLVNVGVAYGSNPSQVRAIIMEILESHPNILSDPPPLVTFESFGDSALNFVVRAFLPNLDNRLSTIHDLHSEIHDRLTAAGIEIPFPQHDLHLRTTVTLDESGQSPFKSNGHSDKISTTQESTS